MNEVWKDISFCVPGTYQISNLGRVRKLNRNIWFYPKPWPDTNGYLQVDIRVLGIRVSSKIHKLVAEHFIGPCLGGYQVNHKDGNRINNKDSNLEYVTNGQNVAHAIMKGLSDRPIITNKQVEAIEYDLKNTKLFQLDIAKKHGVSQSIVSLINLGRYETLQDKYLN